MPSESITTYFKHVNINQNLWVFPQEHSASPQMVGYILAAASREATLNINTVY